MLRPETSCENFVEHVLRIVQIHFDFFEDHLTFFFDVVRIEFRAKDEIRDDIERDRQMLVENFGVETYLLFGSERVQHAADRIHFASDGFRRPTLRALEDHVLDEMSEAVFFRDFPAGAIADPQADRDRPDVGHGLRDDDEAVGQNVLLNVARFGRSRHIEIVAQE